MNERCLENESYFDYVLSDWLLSMKPKLKPTTIATYETILEKHIRPELCAYLTTEITDKAIAKFWENKSAETLAASTLRGISNVLRSCLKYAAKFGCEASCESCAILAPVKKPNIRVLSDEERSRIVSALGQAPRGKALGVIICLYTGLRVGEISGLRWGDISPDCTYLTVQRTVSRIYRRENGQAGTVIHIGEPKSSDSRRKIPLPAILTEMMCKVKQADDCYVLSGKPDVIVEARLMQRYFQRLLDRCGVERVNFHVLRHTFATRCVDLGFDIKVLSMILGHADVGITLNTYVHPSFEKMRSMMALLD